MKKKRRPVEYHSEYQNGWGIIYRGFDELPAKRRREYWDFNVENFKPKDIQKAAYDNYGPDHPQAQGEFLWPLKR